MIYLQFKTNFIIETIQLLIIFFYIWLICPSDTLLYSITAMFQLNLSHLSRTGLFFHRTNLKFTFTNRTICFTKEADFPIIQLSYSASIAQCTHTLREHVIDDAGR